MKKIQIRIITPDRVVVDQESEFVVLPGHSGELGVLAGHTKLFTLLKPGEIRLENGAEKSKVNIAAGVAYIEPQLIRVMTPVARLE